MSDMSSYLRYLPPVLWENEHQPGFSLEAMLQVFEKMLRGIDDAEVIQHAKHERDGMETVHEHEAIETVIGRLHRLFDPWATPPEFLDWLASCVSLRFPARWDEYQRRKVTARIVPLYGQHGLREGLIRYLELYHGADRPPRIAVDDGSILLAARPRSGELARLDGLISQGVSFRNRQVSHEGLTNRQVSHEGLTAPRCMTQAPDGSLFLADERTPSVEDPVAMAVWRVWPPGRYNRDGSPPLPERLKPDGLAKLRRPAALTTDIASSWNLYVLDYLEPDPEYRNATALYRLSKADNFGTASALATRGTLGTIGPVAMAFEPNGHLLILDRGGYLPSGERASPRIIDVELTPVFKVNTPPFQLQQVKEPLSLLVLPNGDLVIGDGCEQDRAAPAELVYVNRAATPWREKPLLAALQEGQNPLVAPIALARPDAAQWYVLDLGLKAYSTILDDKLASYRFYRSMARPATVHRVIVLPAAAPGEPPTVTAVERACAVGHLVYPTGMAYEQGTLYICDRGEYDDPLVPPTPSRGWRRRPHEFGVLVHFEERDPKNNRSKHLQVLENIRDVVDREKPAHAMATVLPSPEELS